MSANDPVLIRLVAGRYRELQGFSTIADAGLPMISAVAFYLISEEWHALILGAVLGLYLWARYGWLRRRLDDYYAQRCGRVAARFVPMTTLGLVVAFGYGKILSDFHVALPVRIVIMMVALSAWPIWIVVRDYPFRLHWLAPALVGFAWAPRLAGLTTFAQFFGWQRSGLLALGATIAFAGLLDHALLVSVLKPVEVAEPATGPQPDER